MNLTTLENYDNTHPKLTVVYHLHLMSASFLEFINIVSVLSHQSRCLLSIISANLTKLSYRMY